jgi:hypothetical protein
LQIIPKYFPKIFWKAPVLKQSSPGPVLLPVQADSSLLTAVFKARKPTPTRPSKPLDTGTEAVAEGSVSPKRLKEGGDSVLDVEGAALRQLLAEGDAARCEDYGGGEGGLHIVDDETVSGERARQIAANSTTLRAVHQTCPESKALTANNHFIIQHHCL